jgi:hypothetical protein
MVVRQAVDVFLRRELPGDQDGVFALHAAAFARPVKPYRKKPFWSKRSEQPVTSSPSSQSSLNKTVK